MTESNIQMSKKLNMEELAEGVETGSTIYCADE